MGIIDTLRAEGALVLEHDYRAGHCQDLSGNGNHGTPTDVMWGRDGAMFPASTSMITVADSPELRLTEGTLIAYSADGFMPESGNHGFVISKRDAGGTNYQLYLRNVGDFALWYGGGSSMMSSSGTGKKYSAIYMKDGETGEGFLDGVSDGPLSAVLSISTNTADVFIGNYFAGNYNLESLLSAALIVNRQLTATEHAQVYAELAERTWPTQAVRRWSDWLGTGAAEGWGGDYGIHVVPNVAPGSRIGIAEVITGAVKVEAQTVDGEPNVKVIECTNNGVCGIRTPEPHSDAAYGTWDWWMCRGSTTQHPSVLLVGDSWEGLGGSQDGYGLTWGSSGIVSLSRRTAGAGTTVMRSDTGYLADAGWHRFTVTRSAGDEWTVYVDGELLDVTGGSGTNPATDATHTSGRYLSFQAETGDAIAWAGRAVQPGLVKRKGVVAP